MYSSNSVKLLFLFSIFGVNVDLAQWVQTDGPQGGYVYCFDVDSTTVLAGTLSSGVFRSTNEGSSWSSSGLSNIGVYAIIHAGTRRLAATNGGIFLSMDEGSTWTESNSGLTTLPIACLAANGLSVFAGRSYYVATEFIAGGVFLSTDGGANWTSSGLSAVGVSALVATDTSVWAIAGGAMLVSRDTGKTWNPSSLTSGGIVGLARRQGSLYACTGSGQVFLSTDGGTNWATSSIIPTIHQGLGFASGLTRLYEWTTDTLFVIDDAHTQWTAVDLGIGPVEPNEPIILGVGVFGSDVYAGTYGYGIAHSVNRGDDWVLANSGLNLTVVTSLVCKGVNLYAGTQFPGKLFQSSNAGISWNNVPWRVKAHDVQSVALNGSDIYVGSYGSGVYPSRDAGVTWVESSSGLTNLNVSTITVAGPNLLAGTYGGGLFLSRDSASSWNSVGPANLGVTDLAASGTNVIAGANSRVLFSTDNGASWSFIDSGITGKFVNVVAISGSRLYAGTDGNGVFVSSNFGSSWVSNGPANAFVRSMTVSATDVFAGSPNGGVFLSTDEGSSWKSVNTGLTDANITAIGANGEYLFVGTDGNGVWRRPLSEMITFVEGHRNELPASFELEQNYPNPFNPSTSIRFSLPVRSRVRVTIFNVLGQQLAELVSEEMNVGNFERVWNARVASGLYFYRLEAVSVSDPGKRFVGVKKMVFIK